MLDITPEQRRRIFEEEKARIDAQTRSSVAQASMDKDSGWSIYQGFAFLLGTLLLIGLVFGYIGSCASDLASSSSEVSIAAPPPAPSTAAPFPENPASATDVCAADYKLAEADAGHSLDKADPSILEYNAVLNSMLSKADDVKSHQQIANVLIHTQDSMREHGVYESLKELAQNIDASMPVGGPKVPFLQMAAIYSVMRTEPSH